MKRIATLAVILLLGFAAQAHSVRYFTYSQAQRTVRYLDAQNEMMIYCGYDYEIETYVLINEVWMERVNSAYYEIWVYGWDAYTGDEIYMPLDLGCVWLYSAGRLYNAAQYLRFHTSVRAPQFSWSIPSYNHFTRVMHRPGFTMTYHYDIHRHGWMPPAHGHHHHHHGTHPQLPPYYLRTPGTPAPRPQATWTPGVDRPQVVTGSSTGHTETGRTTTGGTHTQSTGRGTTASGVRTGGGTSTGTTTTNTRTTGTTTPRSTGTTPTRGNVPSAQPKGDSTSTQGTTTNTRGTGTTTTNTNTRGTTSTTRGTGSTTTTTRGTGTTSTGTRTGGSTSTTTRGTGTTTAKPKTGKSQEDAATEKPKTNTRTASQGTTSTSGSTSTTTRGTATTTAKPKTGKSQEDAATEKPKTNTRTASQGTTGTRTGSR